MTRTTGKAVVKTNDIALKPGSPHSKDEGNVQGAPSSACSPEKGPSRSTSRRPTVIDYAAEIAVRLGGCALAEDDRSIGCVGKREDEEVKKRLEEAGGNRPLGELRLAVSVTLTLTGRGGG